MGELEVIVHSGTSEHHAVESMMILKPCQHGQIEPCAVHALSTCKIANGLGDSKMRLHKKALWQLLSKAFDHLIRKLSRAIIVTNFSQLIEWAKLAEDCGRDAPCELRASDSPGATEGSRIDRVRLPLRLHASCYRCSYLTSFSSRRDRPGAMTVLGDCGNHRPKIMETVAFISAENGDDLIVSFAVIDPEDSAEIESLILLRTPKYEHLLGDWARGVSVSFGRYVEDDEELLEEFHLDRKSAIVRLTTSLRNYELDIRKVDEREVTAMRKVLARMNYDRRFRLLGI
ncbi:hypothetical protein [Paraburkholderia oxyphila]|uniref:hypothetical protein n=1 Tax=Paraburkholderia oxyphila TaxID=614212 RepID=UPI001FE21F4B|nr:hypothetical protein [Paraburkholderia oxyphila]